MTTQELENASNVVKIDAAVSILGSLYPNQIIDGEAMTTLIQQLRFWRKHINESFEIDEEQEEEKEEVVNIPIEKGYIENFEADEHAGQN